MAMRCMRCLLLTQIFLAGGHTCPEPQALVQLSVKHKNLSGKNVTEVNATDWVNATRDNATQPVPPKTTQETHNASHAGHEEDGVTINSFHWEPHWQCAESDASCTAAALQTFAELVNESQAMIAGALELKGASKALLGWSSSQEYGDAVSIMVAPGWQVLKEGGGNICCDGQRGLAVMLVKPPFAVPGCESLCVMAVHPGHFPIQSGHEIVAEVCGSATNSCAIAVGDWNVDAAGVEGGTWDSWGKLVGGQGPSFVVPDSETCCYPFTCCKFDHHATNIPGATVLDVHVWDYQLTDKFIMDEEHMPVAVHFSIGTAVALTA